MDLCRCAFDFSSSHFVLLFFEMIAIAICLSLFGIVAFIGNISIYNRYSANKTFKYGIKNTGVVRFYEGDGKNINQFQDSVDKLENVKYSGDFNTFGASIPEFYSIQKDRQENYLYYLENYVETTQADNNMFKICGIDFLDYQEYNNNDEKCIPVYLGYAFHNNFRVGQIINYKSDKYNICGILKKGQTFPSENFQSFQMSELINVVNTDYKIFLPQTKDSKNDYDGHDIFGSIMMFTVDKGQYDAVKKQMMKIAQDNNITIGVTSIDGLLKSRNTKNISKTINYKRLFFIIAISTIIMICSIRIGSYFSDKKRYGILYACGFSTKDINFMLALENLLLLILSMVVFLLFLILFIRVYLFENINNSYYLMILKDILYRQTTVSVLLLDIAVFAITTFICSKVFASMTVNEMVN